MYRRDKSSVFTVLFILTAFSLYLLGILTPSFPSPMNPHHTHTCTITHKECTLKRICSPKKVGICKATDRFKCQLSWCTVGTLSYKVVSRGHLRETNTRSFTPYTAWTLYGPTVAMNVTVNHLSSWQVFWWGVWDQVILYKYQPHTHTQKKKNLVCEMLCHVLWLCPIPGLFGGLKLITGRGENYTSAQGWWMTS